MRAKGVRAIQLMSQFNLKSDSFLIYCQGYFDKNSYLLIDLLWTDAHEKVRNNNRMIDYAEEAERFYKSGK
jgi:mRNA interferase YafO